ncbi:MAG TPA: hypothetical protein DHW71_06510 [Gammaproteobacteria bacterium]|nr:hypothetical protein [Gammaproteobacteria bacterium]MEC8009725.1 PEP-CTERM sorting domain-containing protein [Pseudomonadota bacterium]HBF07805.1 hypothetical protein [Gammaproteobacteria bacterium]HCK92617.1 hypothetical protein [Gammaproteobacteria bacterium]|tara:strand:+ start:891 stop:1652 length:762 start_codon:yes stop_codon:yes gene_type:complete
MRRLLVLATLALTPSLASAGLVTETSYYDWGYKESYTYVGNLMTNAHEMRFGFDSTALQNNVTFDLFSGDYDLCMYLFDLSEASYLYGPSETSSGVSLYQPGSAEYLGQLLAYDDNSGFMNSGGYIDPRLQGETTSDYISLFIVPSGTTEDMIRANDITAMENLLMAQQSGSAGLDFSFDLGFDIRDSNGSDPFNEPVSPISAGGISAGGGNIIGMMPSPSSNNQVSVPESSTLGLLGIALAGLFGVRRRVKC